MAEKAPDQQQPRKNTGFVLPDYTAELAKCTSFLERCQERDAPPVADPKYMQVLQRIANRDSETLEIDLDDVQREVDSSFAESIETNTLRYVKLFGAAADALMPLPTVDIRSKRVTLDIVADFRARHSESVQGADGAAVEPNAAASPGNDMPAELRRRFQVNIVPRSTDKEKSIRQIRAASLGGLVRVRGIVTRVTDVKPLVTVATYTCDMCGHEIYQPIESKTYTPLTQCESRQCKENKAHGNLYMQTRGSKFDKFQEIRIQELPDQVPIGHIPRSMVIHARGSCTRACMPGDMITITGMFLPTPYTGFRAIKAGLTCDTYLQATSIKQHKKSYSELQLSEDLEDQIVEARRGGDVQLYDRLAGSLAPQIFGLEDVKKALLLLLVGGADRVLEDGMKIRGDINILLMGDPGVAKSQLLKHISAVAPRCVYTTGKGSSGVGLTAAVMRDQLTGEVVLEGGALVLADMGICCIDEFDKMEETDRTAIYEVMEQQTVSIAKAGITTTLNARTSILAAANPAYGRYDKRKTPGQNIDLPVALLSRFDLLFVLVDIPDPHIDSLLANHVLHVHRFNQAKPTALQGFKAEFLRAYISKARTFKPMVPAELMNEIILSYTELRKRHNDERHLFCTPRTLLSILRLAQAAARLRFSNEVSREDVDESIRLFNVAKSTTEEDDPDDKNNGRRTVTHGLNHDFSSVIFSIIKDMSHGDSRRIKKSEILSRASKRGFSDAQLQATIQTYESINVLGSNSTQVWVA